MTYIGDTAGKCPTLDTLDGESSGCLSVGMDQVVSRSTRLDCARHSLKEPLLFMDSSWAHLFFSLSEPTLSS